MKEEHEDASVELHVNGIALEHINTYIVMCHEEAHTPDDFDNLMLNVFKKYFCELTAELF